MSTTTKQTAQHRAPSATTDTPCTRVLRRTHRLFAAEWQRVRDRRMDLARVLIPGPGRAVLVRVARHAHHELLRHTAQVAA